MQSDGRAGQHLTQKVELHAARMRRTLVLRLSTAGLSGQHIRRPDLSFRRLVVFYSYAFFATFNNVSNLQDRLDRSNNEVSALKKSLEAVSAEAAEAALRVDEFRRWGTVAKAKVATMPPSGMPRAHVVVSPEPGIDTARSRSPRQDVRLARIV